ncbi:MAG: Rieske 2Fe-2S domain-containing protein [Gemmatimonas sp.]|nr:Rieske 2Fe-2S domain-containing protein [Gemmatimonas sp.]
MKASSDYSPGTSRPAGEYPVGQASDFSERQARVFVINGIEIGVYRRGSRFYAYRNTCPHQGGPVCEGMVLGKVEPNVEGDRTITGERFSEDLLHIVCPWHGYEYDLTTGRCVTDSRMRLRTHDVVQRGEELYVRA